MCLVLLCWRLHRLLVYKPAQETDQDSKGISGRPLAHLGIACWRPADAEGHLGPPCEPGLACRRLQGQAQVPKQGVEAAHPLDGWLQGRVIHARSKPGLQVRYSEGNSD